jgi:hypothetical protein
MQAIFTLVAVLTRFQLQLTSRREAGGSHNCEPARLFACEGMQLNELADVERLEKMPNDLP